MVVLPEPEGAEKIISLPFSIGKDNSFFYWGTFLQKKTAGTGLSLQSFASDRQKDFRLHPSYEFCDILEV
jgi:hypothetical protein